MCSTARTSRRFRASTCKDPITGEGSVHEVRVVRNDGSKRHHRAALLAVCSRVHLHCVCCLHLPRTHTHTHTHLPSVSSTRSSSGLTEGAHVCACDNVSPSTLPFFLLLFRICAASVVSVKSYSACPLARSLSLCALRCVYPRRLSFMGCMRVYFVRLPLLVPRGFLVCRSVFFLVFVRDDSFDR